VKLEAERPEWLHGLNDVGRMLLASDAPVVPLHEEALLAEACRNTGLDDFGDDSFREPLHILLDSLDNEARLTLMGRVLARSDALNLLENRLQIQETFAKNPEIESERIEGPIFIVGLPRSGTSILHELLAQDPAHRVPLSWEARFPCPPPETVSYHTDPRIERADRIFSFWNELVPAYRTMHEMGGRIPCECIWLTAHSFRSEEFLGRQQVPSYAAWLASADLSPAYAYHRRMLQLLQWKHPAERWMLKAPSHMAALGDLLAEYPDARIIMTHRDPLKTMGSTASILSALSWMRSDEANIELIKLGFGGEGMAHRLDLAMAVRDRADLDGSRFFDACYADLLDDPIGTIAGAYAHFDLELKQDVAERMRGYLRDKPQGKHGAHHYAFEDLELDLGTERARFADYQERFGVRSEVR
jgi:hypothetical protein